MKNIILLTILSVLFTASAVQAVTITGWSHPDYISADITAKYSAEKSSLLLTVKNTSAATSANLRGLLFSASGATLSLKDASYYSQSILTEPLDVTGSWSIANADSSMLSAEPAKYYDGLDTVLFTGSNFQGGNPKLGLEVGWTAEFLFDVEGSLDQPLNQFIARFQSINYPDISISDSDFAHPVATPIPATAWLLITGLIGLLGFKRTLQT